jgi:hypothetical protein
MEAILINFLQDNRTLTLLGLIAVNLITGVMAALVTGRFLLGKVADFYRARVLPYILGYMLVYGLSVVGVAELLGPIAGELAAWAGLTIAVANLLDDIRRNLVDLGMPLPGQGTVTVQVAATEAPSNKPVVADVAVSPSATINQNEGAGDRVIVVPAVKRNEE